jgi:hypothetical protein
MNLTPPSYQLHIFLIFYLFHSTALSYFPLPVVYPIYLPFYSLTRVGPKVSGLTYKSRAKCKMLRGIYSAIYGEVNVSVCVEIKGEYIEK